MLIEEALQLVRIVLETREDRDLEIKGRENGRDLISTEIYTFRRAAYT